VPDSGSLKATIKTQGYDVVIDDSKTHPEGCCDCDGINHFTVWGCCNGTINRDEKWVKTALQKQGAPCENCVPRGDGIESGVDADGNPVWRVFLCSPEPPIVKWFCDKGVCTPCAQIARAGDLVVCPQNVPLYDKEEDCLGNCFPSCDDPLPSSIEVSFATQCLSDKFTLPLVLQDPAKPGIYVADPGGAVSGGLVVGGVSGCNRGVWQVDFGTNLFSPDIGPCIGGAAQPLKCGESWSGNIGGTDTGTVKLNCDPAAKMDNPLP
jgi:hypothetical protein